MSLGVSGGANPDLVNILMMKKAMAAEQTQSAQLLEGLEKAAPPPPPPPPPFSAPRTWYL